MLNLNHEKFMKELSAAGIAAGGCNEAGKVWDIDGITEIQDRPDVAALIAAHDPSPEPPPTEEIFNLPIRTPAVYADGIFVSSRKIKDDPDEALDEAVLESEKEHGTPKSLDLISRSTAKNVVALRQKVRYLEDLVDKLEKRIKKLEK